jgi:hypothetical protein
MIRNVPRWLVVAAATLIPSLALAATAAASHGWCPFCGSSCPF